MARDREAQTALKRRTTGTRIHRQLAEVDREVGVIAMRDHLQLLRAEEDDRRKAHVLLLLKHFLPRKVV